MTMQGVTPLLLHGPLMQLALEYSGTSAVLIRYESMRLRSPRQSERTTERDSVQHKRWNFSVHEDGQADGV